MAKGDYAVPQNIRDMKPKGTIVKKIHGKYYVYEHSYVKDNNTGKWKTKSGKLIGRIDEKDGFIANDSYVSDEEVTSLEYGQYALAYSASVSVLEKLKQVFNPIDAKTIYFMALCSFVNGYTYLRDYKAFFDQSYLSLEFNGLSMSREYLSQFIDDLGRKETRPLKFQQLLINESSKQLAIDGHVIRCCSEENDLAEMGNKYNKFCDTQINLLAAYDVKNMHPVFARYYPGSSLDKVSVRDAIETVDFNDVLFIVDRGFYSEENIKIFTENGCNYIIPLSRNLSAYKQTVTDLAFNGSFLYQKGKHYSSVSYKEAEYKGRRIIIFRDDYERLTGITDYKVNITKNPKKYTEEKLEKLQDYFGMIVLQTSFSIEEKSAQEIYENYKKRWKIENFYGFVKNTCRIEAIHQQGYYKTQGLSFIFLVTGLIQSEYVKKLSKVNGVTIKKSLIDSRFIKINKKGKKWQMTNVKKSTKTKMEKMGFDFEKEAKLLELWVFTNSCVKQY